MKIKFLFFAMLLIVGQAIAAAATRDVAISAALPSENADSAIQVLIHPNNKAQQIEGWGGSLCWWANVMGGYSDEKINQICNWITDPVAGLNMNIFRFNIGGGDAPDHHHMRGDGGDMPGYKDAESAAYNWNADANQRKMLQQLIAARIANTGRNDVVVIGFSNSPPWWMTVSGCSAGSVDGVTCNLKPEMFDDFADYLTDVTKYYHDSLGVTFDNLEPFNEPYSKWWKAGKGQEGCYFSSEEQIKLIGILYAKLKQKNMLQYCRISAMDANSIDEAYAGLLDYEQAGDVLSKISRIDVHSYAGEKRNEIATFAKAHHLPLWQSESGPLSVEGSAQHQMMIVCDRIITDFKEMNCKAWIDWQLAADNSPQWGLLVGKYKDSDNPVEPGINFNLRAQFSAYLKTNYCIIENDNKTVLTAMSPDNKQLVIVVSNSAEKSKNYDFDLTRFAKVGKIQKILTLAQASLHVKNSTSLVDANNKVLKYLAEPQSVCTFVVSLK